MTVIFDQLFNHIANDIHSIVETEFGEDPDDFIKSEETSIKIMPWGLVTLKVPLKNDCVIEKTFRFGLIEQQTQFVETVKEYGMTVEYSDEFLKKHVTNERLLRHQVDSSEDMESFVLLDPIDRVDEWVYVEANRNLNNGTVIKGEQWIVKNGLMLNQCKEAVYELLEAFEDDVKESDLVNIVTNVIDKFANDESKCTITHHDHFGRRFTEVTTKSGVKFFLDIVCKQD